VTRFLLDTNVLIALAALARTVGAVLEIIA
jgi:hypothetical protein